jgi:hypothetical protein
MEEKNKSILTIYQKKILDLICEEKYFTDRYYLAGGTALAEFHLKHRISEDLDFFTEKEEVDSVAVARFFEKNKNKLKITSFETKRVFGLFSFFFNFEDGEKLKVDFNYYPFPLIEKGLKYKNLKVEGIYDIAIDKIHTVVLNPRARDFIDIYFIIKERNYSFDGLIMKAKAKFDWHISAVELGARFLQAAELKDYPRMIKKVDHKEWKQFFIDYAIKMKKQIFK